MNRGVSIRYGKNLTDIQQDQNCSNVATGVYPYWAGTVDEKDVLVELPERIVNAPGTYNFVKIRTLDLSSEFETQPTVEQLRAKTENYITANNIGVPSVSLTVSFAQLEQTEEYKHMKLLERVSLFDTVNVEFPALGVSATAKAVKMVYDVLADRVKSVTLGSVRANIADTIANQQQEIQNTPTKSDLQKAQEAATAWLTNGKGYKVERRDDLGRVIDTLYMDTPDIETAVNIMRVGQSGIGFSHNGVNGPYLSAWTIDGRFVADWITAGTLNAALVKVINLIAEQLSSVNGSSEVRINGAEIRLLSSNNETVSITNEFEGLPIMYMFDIENGSVKNRGEFSPHHVKLGGSSVGAAIVIGGRGDTNTIPYMILGENGEMKNLSWKYSEEFGCDVLCGQ
jgi:phage-related protein